MACFFVRWSHLLLRQSLCIGLLMGSHVAQAAPEQPAWIDGLAGDVRFERLTAEGELTRPLWLGQNDSRVLAGMIGYILKQIDGGQLQIRPDSETALRELHPQVEALTAASESDDG